MADLLLEDDFYATPGRFLWHASMRTVVLADLHLGFAAAQEARGNFAPEFAGAALNAAWDEMLTRSPRRIIINGDLFDALAPAVTAVEQARDLFNRARCQITLVHGNHDPAVGVLHDMFAARPVDVAEQTEVAGWSVRHGHELSMPAPRGTALPGGGPEAPFSARGLILGHQHPAVILRDRVQSAKMICFARTTLRTLAADDRGSSIPTLLDTLPTSPEAMGFEATGVTARRGTAPPGGVPGSLSPAPRDIPVILLPAFSPAPLGSNLLNARQWIIDAPAPSQHRVRIAGIVGDRVLDFGTLDALGQVGGR